MARTVVFRVRRNSSKDFRSRDRLSGGRCGTFRLKDSSSVGPVPAWSFGNLAAPICRTKPSDIALKMHSVLTVNSGSSSLRFALLDGLESLPRILVGRFERIGSPGARLSFTDLLANRSGERMIDAPDQVACVPLLVELLEITTGVSSISAVGHRVVHGGPRYREPRRVDGAMLEELRRISSFAPNHLPATIALMEIFAARFPEVPQIACFDTAFHSTLPRVARLLPIPRRYEAKGVQRYGFHGLSYSFLMQEIEAVAGAKAARGRVVLAHLGNGASMTAVRDGKSMDTSMGFTPAAGLVMSTRAGALDPGLVAFLGVRGR